MVTGHLGGGSHRKNVAYFHTVNVLVADEPLFYNRKPEQSVLEGDQDHEKRLSLWMCERRESQNFSKYIKTLPQKFSLHV